MNASERPRATLTHTHIHTCISTEKCTVLCLSKRLTMLRKDKMHNSLEFQSSSLPLLPTPSLLLFLYSSSSSLSSSSLNNYLKRKRKRKGEVYMFIMYTFMLRLCTVKRKNVVYTHIRVRI